MLWCSIGTMTYLLLMDVTYGTDLIPTQTQRTNIIEVASSKSRIKLKWLPPTDTQNEPSHYIVSFDGRNTTTENARVLLKHLKSYHNYTINIFDCYDYAKGDCKFLIGPLIVRTRAGIPSQVENFNIQELNSTHICLSWDPAKSPSGLNLTYSVRIVARNNTYQFYTSEEMTIISTPICRQNDTNASVKVIVNAINEEYFKEKIFRHKSIDSSTIILFAKCKSEEFFKMKMFNTTTNEIGLQWTEFSEAANLSYLIRYNDEIMDVNSTTVVLSNLKASTEYNISISACNDECRELTSFSIITHGRAEKVENIVAERYNMTHFKVSWKPSLVSNGNLPFYRIGSLQNNKYEEFDTSDLEVFIHAPECEENDKNVQINLNITAMNRNKINNSLLLAGVTESLIIYYNCVVKNLITPALVDEKPKIEKILIGNSSIYLQWTPAIGNYRVEYNSTVLMVNQSEVKLLDLCANCDYNVTIQKCGENCAVIFGPLMLHTSLTPVFVITNLTASDLNSTHIRITWQPSWTMKEMIYSIQINERFMETFDTSVDVEIGCANVNSSILVRVVVGNESIETLSGDLLIKCTSFSLTSPGITQIDVASTWIFLQWENSLGENTTYEILYNNRIFSTVEEKYMLTNLTPDTSYWITLFSCNPDCSIKIASINIRTNAAEVVTINNVELNARNTTHTYVKWSLSKAVGAAYEVQIFNEFNNLTTKTIDSFLDIKAPTCDKDANVTYFIKIIPYSNSSKNSSEFVFQPSLAVLSRQCTTLQESTHQLYIEKITVSSTTIELQWNCTDEYDKYLVHYNNLSSYINQKSCILSNLSPNSSYEIEILGCNSSCTLLMHSLTLQTKIEYPLTLHNITAEKIEDGVIHIFWTSPPLESNFSYIVRISHDDKEIEYTTSKAEINVPNPFCKNNFSSTQFLISIQIGIDKSTSIIYPPIQAILLTDCSSTTAKQLEPVLSKISIASSWMEIEWNDTNIQPYSSYNFTINDNSFEKNDTKLRIPNLVSNKEYKVQIYKCEPHCRSIIGPFVTSIHQDMPKTITLTDINSTHIRLAWEHSSMQQMSEVNGYNIRTIVDKTLTIFSTKETQVDLETPVCKNNASSITYTIEVLTQGESNLTYYPMTTTILVKCVIMMPNVGVWSINKEIISTGLMLIVGIGGFCVGLGVSLLKLRKFSYKFEVKENYM